MELPHIVFIGSSSNTCKYGEQRLEADYEFNLPVKGEPDYEFYIYSTMLLCRFIATRSHCTGNTGMMKPLHIQLLKPFEQVQLWLSKAETMITEAANLIEDGPQELKNLCLCGCASKKCLSRYKFGKKEVKMCWG
ncbi:hypothetical protein Gogos_021122 [Gossypium gossypioides]|uniref:Uncharacterized protein n=1 Tax=Gossypium gossypioides TaxID=34282 RepID=A0A7J9D3V9_GOSGO|nr:hypothetical protein [Gossypium gossypioides]